MADTERTTAALTTLLSDSAAAHSTNRQLIRDIVVSRAAKTVYNVRDYDNGAGGDDTIYLAAAILDAKTTGGSGARVEWKGNLNVSDTITIDSHRIQVWGKGRFASAITFNPTSAKPLFKVQNSNTALVIYQGSFGGFSLAGAGSQQKIAFDLWDTSEFLIEDIAIQSSWTGNSGSTTTPSIGLRTNGREALTLRRADIFADRPIHVRVNPNAATLSLDHFHCTDLYFSTQVGTEAGILVDANCVVSNWSFEGYQAWVGGKYGLDFTSGGAGAASLVMNFSNIRYEQSASATGFAVRWQPPSSQNISFKSCYFGGVSLVNGGVFIRNTSRISFDDCLYSGGAGSTFFDADSTCDQIWFRNTFPQDSSAVNLGTLEEIFSVPKRNSNSPIPGTVYYCAVATTVRALKVGGVLTYCYKAAVVSGGTLPLSIVHTGNGLKSATVAVAGYSATGPIDAGGMAIVTPTGPTLIAGTANFAVGNVGAKLCVFTNNPCVILNNTAQTLSVVVTVTVTYT